MNQLKTHTRPTDLADTFKVYWTNTTMRLRGVVTVQITSVISDRAIAAELAAMQYLLEDQCVIGDNVVGNIHTQIIVSQGAIRKLQRRDSDKAHLAPYASFLVTRFAACPIIVDKKTNWFEDSLPELTETIVVDGARCESVQIMGVGNVLISQHVLMKFAERDMKISANDCASKGRLPNDIAPKAWKKLVEAVTDSSVHEVYRDSMWAGVSHRRNGRTEGRYFLNPKRNLILVLTDNAHRGMNLVTTYHATANFHALPPTTRAATQLALTA